jgi:hypothetical protein
MASEELRLAAVVVERLQALGIRCLIGGSLASSHYGRPRSTHDIDLAARIAARDISALVRAFAADFYVAEAAVSEAVRDGSAFNLVHYETMLKVDVFVLGDDQASADELRRAAPVLIDPEAGLSLPLASPEDVVVRKLAWLKTSGSQRQWDDVLGVLQVQRARWDLALLRRLAAELGVEPELARALVEAGLESGDLFGR